MSDELDPLIEGETEVDLGASDIDIEVVDDTPEADQNREPRPDDQEPDIPGDEEIESYGDRVQKRLKQLRYEFHEERRSKERAMRENDEAVRYAQALHAENERLKQTLVNGESVLKREAEARVEAQLAQAREAHHKAFEAGDADAVVAAQEALAKATFDGERVARLRAQQPQQQPMPPMPLMPAQPEPDTRAERWREENEWFETDTVMRGAALGLHQQLIQEGYDPRSDEYYARIDKEMRTRFPEQLGGGGGDDPAASQPSPRGANVVAPSERTSGNPRRMKLTASAVATANRLGVPLEEYAKQLLILQKD